MVTASASTPNMQHGENTKSAPIPDNWHGVTEGLNKARKQTADAHYQEAINTLKEVLEFAPSEPQAWRLLGDILRLHGHTKADACHTKAASFEKHANMDANATPISERLAKLLWSQGEADAARAMLALLLLRSPDNEGLIEMRNTWDISTSEGQI